MGSRSTLRPRLVAFAAAAALATATITSCVNVTTSGNAAFVDVLARDVRGAQAPPWVRDDALRQLAAGTSRSKVVDAAIASQDADDTVIQDAFRTVLGHPPTFDEESAWIVAPPTEIALDPPPPSDWNGLAAIAGSDALVCWDAGVPFALPFDGAPSGCVVDIGASEVDPCSAELSDVPVSTARNVCATRAASAFFR